MRLIEGQMGQSYIVESMELPLQTGRRLGSSRDDRSALRWMGAEPKRRKAR